jgi:small conductance mechanosensitive channel
VEPIWSGLRDHPWGAIAIAVGLRIAGALLVLLVGIRIIRWIAGAAERALTRAHVEATAVMFLRKVAYVLLLVVLLLAVLQVVGVPMTSMIAVLGAAGLAIGLALKDSLSNIASGVMLVTLKPFRVGDIVTIAGETGRVESVSIFQTQLRGPDNQTIVLPNSLITTDSIINLTPDTMRRVELTIGIGYSDDIELARAEALKIIHADARVLAEPAPDVVVYGLGDNSVDLGIRWHVANADWFSTKVAITERIKVAFDAAGITIPYPQRDVHMYHHGMLATQEGAGPANANRQLQAPAGEVDDTGRPPATDPR